MYAFRSVKDRGWYTGVTIDLRKRILSHNLEKNCATKSRKPWKCIYAEACINKNNAFAREKYLKSGTGKRYLKNRLKFFFVRNF